MDHWRMAYLGIRQAPRERSEFRLNTFFTFSRRELASIFAALGSSPAGHGSVSVHLALGFPVPAAGRAARSGRAGWSSTMREYYSIRLKGYHYRRRDGSLSTDKSADRQSLVGTRQPGSCVAPCFRTAGMHASVADQLECAPTICGV
jgi:hypothetical protein